MKFLRKKSSKECKPNILSKKEIEEVHVAKLMCASDYIKVFHSIDPEIVKEDDER